MPEPSVEQLERAMFSHLVIGHPLKVAMIVVLAVNDFPGFGDVGVEISTPKINEALKLLASRQDVQAFGDILRWRFSELSRELSPDRLDTVIATGILTALDALAAQKADLDRLLSQIEDQEVREHLQRSLSSAMGILNGKIGREAQRSLSQLRSRNTPTPPDTTA